MWAIPEINNIGGWVKSGWNDQHNIISILFPADVISTSCSEAGSTSGTTYYTVQTQIIIAGFLEVDNCYGYTIAGSGATSLLFEQQLTADATGLSAADCASQLEAQTIDTIGIMLQSEWLCTLWDIKISIVSKVSIVKINSIQWYHLILVSADLQRSGLKIPEFGHNSGFLAVSFFFSFFKDLWKGFIKLFLTFLWKNVVFNTVGPFSTKLSKITWQNFLKSEKKQYRKKQKQNGIMT